MELKRANIDCEPHLSGQTTEDLMRVRDVKTIIDQTQDNTLII